MFRRVPIAFYTGVVSSWKRDSPFGFIKDTDSGASYFLHKDDIVDGRRNGVKSLPEGFRIEFDKAVFEGRTKAVAVTLRGGAPITSTGEGSRSNSSYADDGDDDRDYDRRRDRDDDRDYDRRRDRDDDRDYDRRRDRDDDRDYDRRRDRDDDRDYDRRRDRDDDRDYDRRRDRGDDRDYDRRRDRDDDRDYDRRRSEEAENERQMAAYGRELSRIQGSLAALSRASVNSFSTTRALNAGLISLAEKINVVVPPVTDEVMRESNTKRWTAFNEKSNELREEARERRAERRAERTKGDGEAAERTVKGDAL